ncbi:hypothetical protein QJQ45_025100, partial [Haematococcus lacustris]
MTPKRKRKRPVSHAQSAAGASGSGQQVQGQGQAAKVVIAERRQVIKAGLRGLVEAARPDLSPAQVDAVVAEVNKRMTMGSKQYVLAAVLCLAVLTQSFLGQPTPGFPAAGPAPGPPPPPDPTCPPYAHPRLPTRNSPRTAAAPAQLPPPVQLDIWDPQLLAQIRDAMELLTKASVLEHLMRGPHHRGIRLLPGEVAVFEQPSSAWLVAKLQELDEVHLQGDLNSLIANATKIRPSIKEYYRHSRRFIKWWGKAVGVVEGGVSRDAQKHFPQVVLDYSLPDPQHSSLGGWQTVETEAVSTSAHFVSSQAVKESVELPIIGRQLTATGDFNPPTHIAVGVDPDLQQLADATPAGTTLDGPQAHIQALKANWDQLGEEDLKPRWRRQRLALYHAQECVIGSFCKE